MDLSEVVAALTSRPNFVRCVWTLSKYQLRQLSQAVFEVEFDMIISLPTLIKVVVLGFLITCFRDAKIWMASSVTSQKIRRGPLPIASDSSHAASWNNLLASIVVRYIHADVTRRRSAWHLAN